MKTLCVLACFCLLGCSSTSANPSKDAGSSADIRLDASVHDPGLPDLPPLLDAGDDGDGAIYNPCAHSWTAPLVIGTIQATKCLDVHFCTDSDNMTYSDYFIDNCQNPPGTQMPCRFDTSCYDGLQYCLPLNDQGFNREYESDTCFIKVGLVGMNSYGVPASNYIGERACIAPDSGMAVPHDCLSITGSTMPYCRAIYTRGNKMVILNPDCPLSYIEYDDNDGTSQCYCENPGFIHADWFLMPQPQLIPAGLFVANCDPVSGLCTSR